MTLTKAVNVGQVPQRSIFRYPGGKTWLVPIIRKWLGHYNGLELLAEPFAGGGIVGLTAVAEGLVGRVVLAELDEGVAAVWLSTLNGHSEWLCRKIKSFQFTEENVRRIISEDAPTLHGRAFKTIVHNRASRSGIMAEGAGLIKTGENGRGIASRWYPATLQERIRGIKKLSCLVDFVLGDGFAVMEEHLHEKTTALFIDPPYTVASRRLYRHNDVDHERLFSLASQHQGPCLLTYDDTKEVRTWAKKYGVLCKNVAMQNAHLDKKKELLISRDFRWLL